MRRNEAPKVRVALRALELAKALGSLGKALKERAREFEEVFGVEEELEELWDLERFLSPFAYALLELEEGLRRALALPALSRTLPPPEEGELMKAIGEVAKDLERLLKRGQQEGLPLDRELKALGELREALEGAYNRGSALWMRIGSKLDQARPLTGEDLRKLYGL